MTQAEISNFLAEGAIFRDLDGKCSVFEGPFSSELGQNLPNRGKFDLGMSDFYASQGRVFSAKRQRQWQDSKILTRALTLFIEQNPLINKLTQNHFQPPSKSEYQGAFQDVQARIEAGQIQKAVPSVFATVGSVFSQSVSLTQRALWLHHLLSMPNSLYIYGFWQGSEGFLGATPETLFRYRDKVVETMALAGTLPKLGLGDEAKKELFLADPKERQEHQLVIDDILQQLQPLGAVSLGETEVVEFPTLYHLRTKIELWLSESVQELDFLEALILRLHPTPALGVFPRSADYRLMQSHPGQAERGIFGGPVFFNLPNRDVICLVAIRNVQWDKQGIRIGTGGGVVRSSELEREWAELKQKREAIFYSLGIEK